MSKHKAGEQPAIYDIEAYRRHCEKYGYSPLSGEEMKRAIAGVKYQVTSAFVRGSNSKNLEMDIYCWYAEQAAEWAKYAYAAKKEP
jgi:hypothetical protein